MSLHRQKEKEGHANLLCIVSILENVSKDCKRKKEKLVRCNRVGQNPIYTVYIVYTVILAGKPPNVRSYTVYIYGSGRA